MKEVFTHWYYIELHFITVFCPPHVRTTEDKMIYWQFSARKAFYTRHHHNAPKWRHKYMHLNYNSEQVLYVYNHTDNVQLPLGTPFVSTSNKASRTKWSESSDDLNPSRDKEKQRCNKPSRFFFLSLYRGHNDVEKLNDVLIKLTGLFVWWRRRRRRTREQGGDLGPRLVEGMLGSDGEGPDCLCSRASLANWNVWVHGVQEDPRSPLAVSVAFECALNLSLAFARTKFRATMYLMRLISDAAQAKTTDQMRFWQTWQTSQCHLPSTSSSVDVWARWRVITRFSVARWGLRSV